jgi:adenylate cyclase class 2
MVETEMKLPVASLVAVRDRLTAVGAVRLHEAEFEDNQVLDDANGSLRSGGKLLRLRRTGALTIVTFKGPGSFAAGVKTRPEYETAVESADAALTIFAALGFAPVRRYQKRREEWSFVGVRVALDETPIGTFVEVEGEKERITEVAVRLGLDPADAVSGTYLDLWRLYRAVHPEAGEDMVFP